MIFFFRSVIAQILFFIFIIYRIKTNKNIPNFFKVLLGSIYGLEVAVYFVGLFFYEYLPINLFSFIQNLNGVWIVLHIYLVALILILDLLFFVLKKINFHRANSVTLQKTKIIFFTGGLVFIGLQIFIGYNKFHNPEIVNQEFTFSSSSVDNTISYNLIVISDLHLGYIVDNKCLTKYVNKINSLNADIIVINGDIIDYGLYLPVKLNMKTQLKRLNAKKGVFFVPGNHDYKFNIKECLSWLEEANITILRDSVTNIDDKLTLIGRDDRTQQKVRISIKELIRKADKTQAIIYFAHHPNDVEEVKGLGIPLVISGHTHYGQIFPANLFEHLIYTNPYGLRFTYDGTTHYTTSGLGLSGTPLRIGSKSEIVVFKIIV